MSTPFRIGVVGFSAPHFDHDAAKRLLADAIARVLSFARVEPRDAELVSGLTDCGVPALAYRHAVNLGMRTAGVSARRALRSGSGVFPVDRRLLVGERYGDESATFIAMIDALVRVGGGPQSRREAAMFRDKLGQLQLDPEGRLVEEEVEWTGR